MSIEMDTQSATSEVKKHKSKSSKKEKSAHGEKKRKREHGEDSTKKSKKHKSKKSGVKEEELDLVDHRENADTMEDVEVQAELPIIPRVDELEEEQSQKPKKKRSKKHKADREKMNGFSQIDDTDVPEHQVKKSKSKSHKHNLSAREEVADSEEERQKSKPKKHLPVEVEPEEEIQPSQSKKHRDLPDRTATSSPMPVPAATPSQKSKSKKSKKSKSSRTAAEEPIKSDPSPFHTQTSSLFLPLAPVSQRFPLEGLCAEHISPLMLTYYPPMSGVILAYSNPRLAEVPFGDDGDETLLQNIDEYAVSWSWVTCEFLLFKPERGTCLEGYINLQNEGHLGVVCWNLFNASIQRKCLPADWHWVGAEDEDAGDVEGMNETYAEDGIGYWVDGGGEKIDGTVKFWVREIETSHDKERGFLSIEGTMLSDEAENILLQEEAEQLPSKDRAGRRLGGMKSKGATSLGVPVEQNLMDVAEKPWKRKGF